jgi:hypothetical protein
VGGGSGETPGEVVERFGDLSDAGAQHVIVDLRGVHEPGRLEAFGAGVLPQVRSLG